MKKLTIIFTLLFSTVIFSANICFADGKSKKVACGGEYSSYQHSIDGSSVCCGGEYSSYQFSIDGSSVCAGGKYSSYQHAP